MGSLTDKAMYVKTLGKKVVNTMKFEADGDDFDAITAAENYLKELGYTIGSMQRDAPIAFAKADKIRYISKWHNIGEEDYPRIEGIIVSDDMRNGDVELIFFDMNNELAK